MTTPLPPPIAVNPHGTVTNYVRDRLRQHTLDSYVGVPMSKFPEDLRVYEHLLWMSHADTVIELGVQHGGSALWFRDRLHTLSRYRGGSKGKVLAVDLDLTTAKDNLTSVDPGYGSDITLIEGDVTDPDLPGQVERALPPDGRCLVIEDTGHTFETTLAALRGFARFVAPGGFLVVEDGCVDIDSLRIDDDWPRGVLPALRTWLETEGADFRTRFDLELYGVTCHPRGFLQRRENPDVA